MDDKDINLLVPVNSVSDEFICPICFEIIHESYMTPCSHNFCKECILECLNRKKVCPCCNMVATQQQLFPNKQFDRVMTTIIHEKEKASKEYFDRLINGGINPIQSNNNQITVSPIEQTILSHIQKHIKNYHDYQKKLDENTAVRKQQIKEKYSTLIKAAQTKKDQKEKRRLKNERDDKNTELTIIREQTTKIIEKTTEIYMKEFSIPNLIFPVIVYISIPHKNEIIKYIQLEPSDTVVKLRQEVSRHMETKGDSVLSFEKVNIFALVQGEGDPGIPITDDNIPIIEHYNPGPGAIFVLQGHLKCAKEAPKKCYKVLHPTLDKILPIDYFICSNCNLKWLCGACVEGCHKGHKVDHFTSQIPTWACCYCHKKQCLIANNK